MIRRQHHDVIVIGAGTAGLVAATRLAELGADVCLVAKGIGSTHLAPAAIDVLGYDPDAVASPARAIRDLASAHPEHPYALIGAEPLAAAVEWLKSTVAAGPLPGYSYTGGLERNVMLPTAAGALKPSAVVPETFAGGEAASLGRVVVAGIPAFRDFDPQLCAANLRAAGIDAQGVTFDLQLDRAESNTPALARLLDDPIERARVCAQLEPLTRNADQVGVPAILGFSDPHAVLTDLEDRLGRRVFEIPTVPPSVPGMRLFRILRHALRRAGGRIALGAAVIDHERQRSRVVSIDTATAGSRTTHAASSFVLASGGLHSGAITLDSRWQTRETVLGLPLSGIPEPSDARFVASYFDEQPLARAGVAVDADLHASGVTNVVVAGASLPGAVPWREASGEGIAVASGYRAAQVVTADLGMGARASRSRARA